MLFFVFSIMPQQQGGSNMILVLTMMLIGGGPMTALLILRIKVGHINLYLVFSVYFQCADKAYSLTISHAEH